MCGASRATRVSSTTTTQSDGLPSSSGSSYSGVMSNFQLSQRQEESTKLLRQQKLQASQQCFLSGEEKGEDALVLTGSGSSAAGGDKRGDGVRDEEDHLLTGSSETGTGFGVPTGRNGNGGTGGGGGGDVRKGSTRGAASAAALTTTLTSTATEKKQKGKAKSSSSSSSTPMDVAATASAAGAGTGMVESQYGMIDDDEDRYWVTQEFMSDDALNGLQCALATQSTPRNKINKPTSAASSSSSSSSSIDLLAIKQLPLVPIKEEEPPPLDPTLLNRRIRKFFRG